LATHMPSDSPVVCMDGDGALLMHMGSMATNKAKNLIHVLVNNGMHESVGGQPTAAAGLNLCGIARDAGYPTAIRVRTEEELSAAVSNTVAHPRAGPVFIEVLVKPGVRSDLGRPTTTPQENKCGNVSIVVQLVDVSAVHRQKVKCRMELLVAQSAPDLKLEAGPSVGYFDSQGSYRALDTTVGNSALYLDGPPPDAATLTFIITEMTGVLPELIQVDVIKRLYDAHLPSFKMPHDEEQLTSRDGAI
ncbi:hypothetical protein FOZ63_011522, partial [Perkinsus olseni]